MMCAPDDFAGPVNLGNPDEFTILDVAQKILRITGSHSKIIFRPLPEDDPMHRRPDIRLAGERLGWEPKTDLEHGLAKTVEYFKKVL